MSDDKEDETKETSINLVTEMEDLEVISVTEDMTDEVVTLLAESAFSPSETAEGARDEGCVTLSMMNSW